MNGKIEQESCIFYLENCLVWKKESEEMMTAASRKCIGQSHFQNIKQKSQQKCISLSRDPGEESQVKWQSQVDEATKREAAQCETPRVYKDKVKRPMPWWSTRIYDVLIPDCERLCSNRQFHYPRFHHVVFYLSTGTIFLTFLSFPPYFLHEHYMTKMMMLSAGQLWHHIMSLLF